MDSGHESRPSTWWTRSTRARCAPSDHGRSRPDHRASVSPSPGGTLTTCRSSPCWAEATHRGGRFSGTCRSAPYQPRAAASYRRGGASSTSVSPSPGSSVVSAHPCSTPRAARTWTGSRGTGRTRSSPWKYGRPSRSRAGGVPGGHQPRPSRVRTLQRHGTPSPQAEDRLTR
ncbi:hypothetical protein ACFSTC_16745 [Nonomuraea ferruginea]